MVAVGSSSSSAAAVAVELIQSILCGVTGAGRGRLFGLCERRGGSAAISAESLRLRARVFGGADNGVAPPPPFMGAVGSSGSSSSGTVELIQSILCGVTGAGRGRLFGLCERRGGICGDLG